MDQGEARFLLPAMVQEPSEVYHARTDFISRTMLKDFRKSPRLFEKKYLLDKIIDNPKEANRAPIIKGTAGHAVILEGKRPEECFTIIPREVLNADGHKKGKPWTDFQKAHAGEDLLKEEEVAHTLAMINAVQQHEQLQRLRAMDCICEQSIYWEDEFQMRMRADWVIPCQHKIVCIDFKFVYDASPGAFTRAVEAGLWLQDAMYRDGLEKHFGKPVDFVFAAVDSKEPYRCLLHQLTASAVAEARTAYMRTKDHLAKCCDSGEWIDPYERVINPIQPRDRCFQDDYPAEENEDG